MTCLIIFPNIFMAFQWSNMDQHLSMKHIIEKETGQQIIHHPVRCICDDTNSSQQRAMGVRNKVLYTKTLSPDCTKPLHQVLSTKFFIPPSPVGAVYPRRKKNRSYYSWPLFDNDPEYWLNHRIHSLGNTGWLGGVHSLIAPLATKIIDEKAYGGINVRQEVQRERKSSDCAYQSYFYIFLIVFIVFFSFSSYFRLLISYARILRMSAQ